VEIAVVNDADVLGKLAEYRDANTGLRVVLQEIRRKHDEHEVSVLVQFILLLQRAC